MDSFSNYSPRMMSSPDVSVHLNERKEFDTLVLSSGATKGVIQLGMLHRLSQMVDFSRIRVYSGCSIGTVINLLLICGYSPLDIFSQLCLTNIFHIDRDRIHLSGMVSSILETGGSFSIDSMFYPLESMVYEKLGTIPTLSELLEMTKNHLVCCSYNLTNHQLEYLSPMTHPHLNCLEAVKMSCSIPILFTKFYFNSCVYIDGAIFDSFPVQRTEQYGIEYLHTTPKILGVNVYGHNPLLLPVDSDFKSWTSLTQLTDLVRHLYEISNAPIHWNMERSIHYQSPHVDILSVEIHDTDMEMIMTKSKQFKFFSLGTKTVETLAPISSSTFSSTTTSSTIFPDDNHEESSQHHPSIHYISGSSSSYRPAFLSSSSPLLRKRKLKTE